jgi:hypothetical protein
MTRSDPVSTLRVALRSSAEAAMAATDTESELDELRHRLGPAVRARRLRAATVAAAAAVVIAGSGIGLGAVLSEGAPGHRPAPTASPTQLPSPHWQPPGPVPTGFPTGSYQRPGTFGLTHLTLRRNGTASLLHDPLDVNPTQMRMTFAAPDLVRFTDTAPGASTVTTSCTDHDGVYRWSVARGELTLTVVSDPCVGRQIPLSEAPWGPIAGG